MANSYQDLLEKLVNGHGLEVIRGWVSHWFVRKEAGKGLSEENYTAADKERIETMITQEDLDEGGYLNGDDVLTDEEAIEMINDVFGVPETVDIGA